MKNEEAMEELRRLLEQAAAGEQAAYRELYRRFRPALRRLLAGFASLDTDEVEDIVQESFVRAFRALPKLKERQAFPAWLMTIGRNRAISMAERKLTAAKAKQELASEPEPETTLVPPALQREREVEEVRRLIDELPEGPEKQTVQLFYVEGKLSAREIADQLGVGKSAVTMRLERFRARVKRELLSRVLAAQVE